MISMISLRNTRPTVLTQTAKTNSVVPMVATKRLSLSCCFAPIYWAISTCPALEKPMAIKVMQFMMSPPTEMADRPTLPRVCPTMIMSAML